MSDQSSTEVFESSDGHEQVVFCHDDASGLRAIIAIYSTALGPALGGTRFFPYATEREALHDVLNLSKAMAYKAALAGLDLGGGKAVIIGDPHTDKTEALLRAYGRFVQSLGGRYLTACDVGTYSDDMDVVARECDFVTGRTVEHGGAGDSSVLTAFGVYPGHARSSRGRVGRPVAARSSGRNRRGRQSRAPPRRAAPRRRRRRCRHRRLPARHRAAFDASIPTSRWSLTPRRWPLSDLDVYAPCALGEAIDDDIAEQIKARIICGAANNQLAHDRARRHARRPRRPLRARLLRQRRRADPGGRRARGLLVRAGHRRRRCADLRHHARGLRRGIERRRHAD